MRSRTTSRELKRKSVYTSMWGCLQKFPVCVTSQLVAHHHGVRPLVYRRIYNTQVYLYGRKQNGAGMQKERSHWFFVFRPLLCLWFSSFLFFFFSNFLQIAIAAKIIEKHRHMQYLVRYEVARAPSSWKLDFLKNKRVVFTRKSTKEVQKNEEDEG